MVELIGRFHPSLVHLPIGILLLAIFFEWLPSKKKFRSLKRSIVTTLSIGSITAILSCLSGYLLSQHGDYESDLVGWHQWMGITLAVYSLAYAGMRRMKEFKSFHKLFSIVLLILLVITGHLGGSLTHGEDYLFAVSAPNSSIDVSKVNLEEAAFYNDLVKPILKEKCYGCHGASKQKGKLRLDEPQHILKGGKDGVVIVAGKIDESELIDRIDLLLDDEDHMPPKEKKQLTEKEIEVLKSWIAAGADFNKSVVESGQLTALEKIFSSQPPKSISDIPAEEVRAADPSTLDQLQKLSVAIVPVAVNKNYLSANLINVTSLDSVIDLLIKVKEQLVWLKASGQLVTDTHLSRMIQLDKLIKLSLDKTQITDAGLAQLKSLPKLQYLNLNGNKITSTGLNSLKGLTDLKAIFVYQTLIKSEEIELLKKSFPNVVIEWGGYSVPMLLSDTTLVTAPLTK
jgi:uncharacterized membrane protein